MTTTTGPATGDQAVRDPNPISLKPTKVHRRKADGRLACPIWGKNVTQAVRLDDIDEDDLCLRCWPYGKDVEGP